MYFMADGKTLMLPSTNIMSLLSSQNTMSAPKRFLDSRKYKLIAQAFLSYVTITPFEIPFLRKGKPIVFKEFGKNGFSVDYRVARLKDGIPNPKERPVVDMPWELAFEMHVLPNNEFNEDMLYNMLEKGLLALGLGTFRGVYGKAVIDKWE